MKAESPGELVQIDHMTVSRDGQPFKEFRAVDPVSRVMVCRVFSRASAGNAKRFLEAVLADMPFPVQSVQVDGGSEFMAECEARQLRCSSCRRAARSGTGGWSAATTRCAWSSGPSGPGT